MLSIQDNLILDDPDRGIVLPTVKYHTHAQITEELCYNGVVVPVPDFLITYLKGNELKVFMLILGEMRKHTMCYMSQTEMGQLLGVTNIAVSHAMHNLVDMGFVILMADKGVIRNNRKKVIDFQSIAKLKQMFDNAKPGSPVKFREHVGTRNVNNFTAEQLEWFDTWCGFPKNDIEAEEYN